MIADRVQTVAVVRRRDLVNARLACACLAALFMATRSVGAQSAVDSALVRARQLVTDGNGAAGRAVVDSLLAKTPASAPAVAEILWWRATYAEVAATAERDYLRIAVEFSASMRAADALLRLGQLEVARGARDGAVRHFDRLVTEHPESPLVTDALFWKGRTLIDGGDSARGCAAIVQARGRTPSSDVERRNQLEFYGRRCVGVDTTAQRRDSAKATPTTPAVPPVGRTTPTKAVVPEAPAMPFSVQLATVPKRSEAEKIAQRAERKGFDARVIGTRAPYGVWVGKYATRAAAEGAKQRIAKAGFRGARVAEGG
jgi:hypothetical protein